MGWAIVFYNCALPDDGPLKPKTRRRLRIKILSYLYLSLRIFGHIVTYSVSRNYSARQMAAPLLILKWRRLTYEVEIKSGDRVSGC